MKKNVKTMIYIVIVVTAMILIRFVKNYGNDGINDATGIITNKLDDTIYASDCIIISDSKTHEGPWISYGSIEELNMKFNTKLEYGDRVYIKYTSDGIEIAPQPIKIVAIKEIGETHEANN